MQCHEVIERLSPFLDDELDPVASAEVARHVASCSTCAAELTRLRAISAGLQRELDYHGASDLLRARVLRDVRAATIAEAAPVRPASPPQRWLVAAAAAVVLLGGAWMMAVLPRASADDALAREVVAGHVRSLMANHLMDVASTDQHTVKPWFSGKLDFSPPVTDFAAAGYPLVGGRLDVLQDHPVAALVYTHRKHVINVFVWPAAGAREGTAPPATRQGYHVIHGAHAGMAWWLVSDLNAEELAAFARMLEAPPAP